MKTNNIKSLLFAQLSEPFIGEALFDYLTDLVFFVKNSSGQYVVVNQSLATRCGFQQKEKLIGRTPDEIYSEPLGVSYRQQDEILLRTGKPIVNQLELQLYPTGKIGWCLTYKVPLKGAAGEIVGLVGISKDLHAPQEKNQDYSPISKVIQYIQNHYDRPLKIPTLAQQANMSPYQFEQRMNKIFEITTGQFIQKVRMDAAVCRLEETNDPIVEIALDCGYSDQSTFSRKFKNTTGLSPGQYRCLRNNLIL